jgi:hypothetical protein
MPNEPVDQLSNPHPAATQRRGRILYTVLLWALLAVLFAALASCVTGSKEKGGDTSSAAGGAAPAGSGKPLRLLLGGNESLDSIRVVNDYAVDQVIRQITDSIPAARYLTINRRDSLVTANKEISLADLGRALDLDGVIYTRTARFGSTLAVELRVIEPAGGRPLFRDLSFVTIRFRDREGRMLIGPALYSAVRKSLRAFFALPHADTNISATEPLLISGIVIPQSPSLGRLTRERGRLAETASNALAEYAIRHFPEIVPLDPDSRDRLYESMKVGRVESAITMSDIERDALVSVGVERYLGGEVADAGADSIGIDLVIHQIASNGTDSIIDRSEIRLPRTMFETSTMEEDFLVTMIDLAEPLFKREAERVRTRYTEQTRMKGGTR